MILPAFLWIRNTSGVTLEISPSWRHKCTEMLPKEAMTWFQKGKRDDSHFGNDILPFWVSRVLKNPITNPGGLSSAVIGAVCVSRICNPWPVSPQSDDMAARQAKAQQPTWQSHE